MNSAEDIKNKKSSPALFFDEMMKFKMVNDFSLIPNRSRLANEIKNGMAANTATKPKVNDRLVFVLVKMERKKKARDE